MYGKVPSFMKNSGSLTKLMPDYCELSPVKEEKLGPGPAVYSPDRYHQHRRENHMR